ncbi:biotin transporter BioY [Clostridium sp. 19966]|uniref:biotin transporter BioY n=1 Tax=Clostridium sp. 19966 TaxID=2768166 RepID=UPI0028DF6856|nr:biotin transporter BioY [Clostridium sp. 19966]MDT8716906.1 biotin transporter BioY [Clostridium sp. 19966]
MKIKTRDMILAALFTALTIVGAFIKIPIGPAPISLQYLFIALSGILLGPALGSASQLVYVILGLIGIPVFTSGGGLSYIFTPTFGYLISFIIAPLIIGSLIKNKKPSFLRIFIACFAALIVTYIIGSTYMYVILNYVSKIHMNILQVLKLAVIVFIPGDISKCIIAALIGKKAIPILRKMEY